MRDDPYELFTAPLADILRRLIMFIATLYVAGILVCYAFAMIVEGKIDMMLFAITPILPFGLIYAGISSGPGLISYTILAFLGFLFMATQMRYRWLWLVFLIQGAEAFRLMYSAFASV
ncbi:hypothetical protein [Ruficoccus sp. ZRK36]|uniref:hypothetical protein n=1 Tax=Ruficoccus sp. ZRK36 TaxID=2866311 RepID=UPI001C72CFAD|nr:hypothetical protein [Ruficoccus sp. ZRK36]QYY37219.1 hypothetical protein K0V07_06980 [Ruficoccus sp. ZRK36]